MFPEETSGRISKLSYINPVVIKQGEIIELQAKPLQKDQVIELQIMNRELATDIWKPAAIGQCQKVYLKLKSQYRELKAVINRASSHRSDV